MTNKPAATFGEFKLDSLSLEFTSNAFCSEPSLVRSTTIESTTTYTLYTVWLSIKNKYINYKKNNLLTSATAIDADAIIEAIRAASMLSTTLLIHNQLSDPMIPLKIK
jgi:hypothetical protein